MIISIAGMPGSGKSTLAKMLAEKLSWPRYCMGELWRERAKTKGLTSVELAKLGETDSSFDKSIDEYQKQLGETQDNFIIEGRTSWHFIPRSFKIFLDIDEKVGANYIYQDLVSGRGQDRNEDKNLDSVEAVLESNRVRVKSDDERYKKYFGINVFDKSNYDLVIDTTKLKMPEVFNLVYKEVKKQLRLVDKN